jgi:hypothetical protein
MTQVIIAVAVLAVALVVGAVLRSRRTIDAPTQPVFAAPAQVDRADFVALDAAAAAAPWLVAVFSSATCQTCADTVRKADVLACADVAVVNVEHPSHLELHRKYRIDAVPIVVVADRDGVVRASFVGPTTATDLWAAVAEARQPGTSPEPGLGRTSD